MEQIVIVMDSDDVDGPCNVRMAVNKEYKLTTELELCSA